MMGVDFFIEETVHDDCGMDPQVLADIPISQSTTLKQCRGMQRSSRRYNEICLEQGLCLPLLAFDTGGLAFVCRHAEHLRFVEKTCAMSVGIAVPCVGRAILYGVLATGEAHAAIMRFSASVDGYILDRITQFSSHIRVSRLGDSSHMEAYCDPSMSIWFGK